MLLALDPVWQFAARKHIFDKCFFKNNSLNKASHANGRSRPQCGHLEFLFYFGTLNDAVGLNKRGRLTNM